jgi:hypothetical protein
MANTKPIIAENIGTAILKRKRIVFTALSIQAKT